jgi:hypothetical protein
MSVNQVGYKLINTEDNSVIEQWGGTWGICPGVPDVIVLPNGDHICAPNVDEEYDGYKLISWEMESEPLSLTAEQKLNATGLTIDDLKSLLGIK